MTERDPPDRPPWQKTLELGKELMRLGHTPESFARVIGRNASGLRRAIRGETKMTPSLARDIIEGLYAEGWRGDPNTVKQLRETAHGKLTRRGTVLPSGKVLMPDGREVDPSGKPGGAKVRREPPPGYRVRRALAELMRAVGREEVDRVYRWVFGTRPDEK